MKLYQNQYVTILLVNNTGIILNLNVNHLFSHTGPKVFSVLPLFGPSAGGTNITITGELLNISESIVAFYPSDAGYQTIRLSNPDAGR